MRSRLPRIAGAQEASGQGGRALGVFAHLQFAHVHLVHELVDHHVVADRGAFARTGHVLPAQHQRAAVHGLAGQGFGVFVHHARVVAHLAAGEHRARLQHDADEIVVPVEQVGQVPHRTTVRPVHPQQRPAGLGGDGQGHGVGDRESVGATELLLGQEVLAENAQAGEFGAVQ